MTWAAARQAVRDNVRERFGSDIPTLETLAREISLDERDTDRSAVGSAIESVLKDAQTARVKECGVAFLLDMWESGIDPETGRYFDRAARASVDAADGVLEARFNSPWEDERDPVTTFQARHGRDIATATPAEWRDHYRAHYSDAEHAAFIAERAALTSTCLLYTSPSPRD